MKRDICMLWQREENYMLLIYINMSTVHKRGEMIKSEFLNEPEQGWNPQIIFSEESKKIETEESFKDNKVNNPALLPSFIRFEIVNLGNSFLFQYLYLFLF